MFSFVLEGVELAVAKERRHKRELVQGEPAVAEAFLRMRAAEEQEKRAKSMQLAEQRAMKRSLEETTSQRNAALAELKKTKKSIKDMENVQAAKYALKTYTVDALGAGSQNAGGAKARNKRFEVLDRMAGLRAGLSPGQRNDWPWFKESWDDKMVEEHRERWGELFAEWMQHLLDDDRSNAFSIFVHDETARVLSGSKALCVPGR